jgi:hypothetical protein
MTPVQRTAAIKTVFSTGLPALLSTAGLEDFDEYLNKSPLRSNDKELCVYIDFDDNGTDTKTFGVMIQAQLYGDDQVQEYHSVIMPFIEQFITADVVGYQTRMNISSDVFPMEPNGSSAFVFYMVSFESQIDDCE